MVPTAEEMLKKYSLGDFWLPRRKGGRGLSELPCSVGILGPTAAPGRPIQ